MQILGISRDSVAANAAFAERYQLPFPVLSDTSGEVCRAYGACDELTVESVRRNTYLIGPDGSIIRVYENADPAKQAELILQLLQERSSPAMHERAPGDDEPPLEDATMVATPADAHPTSAEPVRQVLPSQSPRAHAGAGMPLVFALGNLGVDLVSEARRDSIMQHMDGNPNDTRRLVAYLNENPSEAAAVTWTLSLDATPIYAIKPEGAFASAAYERLRQFLEEQLTEEVERVSVPGVLTGEVPLMSGQIIPVIQPELRCMYSWTTAALVQAVVGKAPAASAKGGERTAYDEKMGAIVNFLERVYHELRNLGITPQDRAVNYAATNALNVERIFERALKEEMELDAITVEPSPVCRPESECFDVKLTFFSPRRMLEQARRVHRFTVDVSDVCPVMVGKVRSWSVR